MFNDGYKDTDRYDGNTAGNEYGNYTYASYSDPEDGKKNKKKKKGFLKSVSLCIVLALIFGVVAGAAFQITDYAGDQIRAKLDDGDDVIIGDEEVAQIFEGNLQPDMAGPMNTVTTVYDVSEVVESAMPSLVSITNMGVQEIQSFFGIYTQESESSGSGIIIGKNDTELLIATNNHVVEDSEQLNVCFIDGTISSALVKGTEKEKDLAVIAVKLKDIPQETMKEITIAEMGDSGNLKIGEPVIAIGNALGYGQSVTTGVVSALNRELTIQNMTNSLIQTDAAINPGNSGGALLNMAGQVIGINSAKLAAKEVEGIGYAIPISTAQPIIDDLMNRTTRSKVDEGKQGFLGITGVDVTAQLSAQMSIPTGVYVASVTDDSGADKAGIKKGDVIVKVDGVATHSMAGLKDLLTYYEAGESVDVVFERVNDGEYEEHTVSVTLGDWESIQEENVKERQLWPDR